MNRVVLFVIGFTLLWISNNFAKAASLTEQIKTRKQKSAGKVPPAMKKIMVDAISDVAKAGHHKRRPNIGDKFPNFELKAENKNKLNMSEFWKDGYAVIKFYRGHWCPYCQLELKAYQDKLEEFKKLGAKVIVLTPDNYRFIKKTISRFKLQFPIYSDSENFIGKKLGIVFGINEEVNQIYKKFQINLKESQSNSENQVPLPATYVVNSKGLVVYKFADADYTLRADPEEVLAALRKQK